MLTGTLHFWGEDFSVPRHLQEVVVFLPFVLAGLVPPFSPFLVATLEEFGLHLVHLTPNAILMLALFAHACEMFMGVRPSVELFRHFFSICRSASASPSPGAIRPPRIVGWVFFRRCSSSFLQMTRWKKW